MKASIEWQGDAKFEAKTGSGHVIEMDGPPESGGQNSAARPMELILSGLGGCASFDVTHILKRARQNLRSCEVELTAERAQSEPKVFTEIHLQFRLKGEDLSEKQVEKAIKLSAEKYCSASIMLGNAGVKITHDYTIES